MRWTVAMLVCLGACEAEPTWGEADDRGLSFVLPEDVEPIIFHGDPPDAPRHDATVSLHARTGGQVDLFPFCSGVLVRDDAVMTAAHCVTGPRGGVLSPRVLAVFVGDDPAADGAITHVYTVDRVVRHHRYDDDALRHDIALIFLDAPVVEAAPVHPLVKKLRITDRDLGRTVDVTGFGLTEHGFGGEKLHVEVTVAGRLAGGTRFAYTQDDGGPCYGDSGGPAFLQRGDHWFVAGLTSYGDADCTRVGVSTHVAAYDAWWRPKLAP